MTTPEKIEFTRQEANCMHSLVKSAKFERLKFCQSKNWSAHHDEEYLAFQALEDKLQELRKNTIDL